MNLELMSINNLSQCVRKLDRETLLIQTKTLVEKERELTAKSLVLFREIESRMIHLEMGHSRLFDMLVKYFKLSEGCASRRVASVRLLAQVPEVEQKIQSGELTLSAVASAQRFFNAEAKNQKPLNLEKKKEILDGLIGKTTREVEKELLERSSTPLNLQISDKIIPKSSDLVEIRFLAPQSLANLLEEAKGILSHRLSPGASMAEVVQTLAEIGLERIKKETFGVGCKERKTRETEASKKHLAKPAAGVAVKESVNTTSIGESDVGAEEFAATTAEKSDIRADKTPAVSKQKESRYIPRSIKRAVYLRAAGKCEYVDPKSGKRCNSGHYPQFHHVIPFARGGRHTVKSLSLFCYHHNRLQAVKDFSPAWMSQFKRSG